MKTFITILLSTTSWLCLTSFTHANEDYRADVATAQQEISIQDQLKSYLFSAARRGDIEMLQEFINSGYDLNTQDNKGYTALILSAYNGHKESVELLIKAGADVCTKDNRGNTALMGAIFKGEIRIARILMNTDCNIDSVNHAGQTPAMYAALFQRTEILNELRDKGADLNKKDQFGNSAETLKNGDIKTTIEP